MLGIILLCLFLSSSPLAINGSHSKTGPITSFDDVIYPPLTANEDKSYWAAQGAMEMSRALNQSAINTNKAKNVIIFLGDGMGFQSVTAARIYKGQQEGYSGEEGYLSFENFPHVGLSKTYCTDRQVTDSAASGTAYLCGVKTNRGLVGVDYNVERDVCLTSNEDHNVFSIAKWSQDVGKRTGFVTTTRVSHASPAGLYAHTAERDWEADSDLPSDWQTTCPDFKDVARQLVEDSPGNKLNVIMGGGYEVLNSDAVSTENDPIDSGIRTDGKNLLDDWLQEKLDASLSASIVRTNTELLAADLDNTDYLFGVFANDHLPYAYLRRENNLDVPSLATMAENAIRVLDKGTEGYFLFVEGGKIDWAHHDNQANIAIDETADFDDAIKRVLEIVDLEETLIIVTADHSHTMGLAGKPPRGNAISGIAGVGDDGVAYTTMMYGTGPGYNLTVVDGEVTREDPSNIDTTSFDYVAQSTIKISTSSHGGEDVPIYAIGPWSHLFYKVHDQVYVAHAMAYASCVGLYTVPCHSAKEDLQKFKNPPSKKF